RVHQHDIRITARSDGFDFHHPDGTHIGTGIREPLPNTHTAHTAAGGPRKNGSSTGATGTGGSRACAVLGNLRVTVQVPEDDEPARVTVTQNPAPRSTHSRRATEPSSTTDSLAEQAVQPRLVGEAPTAP